MTAAFVARSLGVPVTGIAPVAGSVGNSNFEVRVAGSATPVFVKSGPGRLLTAEVWACRRLRAEGLPVPEILAHDETIPAVIQRGVAGGPTRNREVWRQAGEAMRVAHRLTLPGYGGLTADGEGVHTSWPDVVAEVLSYAGPLVAAGILAPEVADRATRLVGSSPVAERREPGVLLHRDLKPLHVFAVGDRLTGIIDWGDAAVGDPVSDIARVSLTGPDVLDAFLEGYGRERNAGLDEELRVYRILRNLETLHFEHAMGGDWFDAYRDRIARDVAGP